LQFMPRNLSPVSKTASDSEPVHNNATDSRDKNPSQRSVMQGETIITFLIHG